jgi:hypothetical protein
VTKPDPKPQLLVRYWADIYIAQFRWKIQWSCVSALSAMFEQLDWLQRATLLTLCKTAEHEKPIIHSTLIGNGNWMWCASAAPPACSSPFPYIWIYVLMSICAASLAYDSTSFPSRWRNDFWLCFAQHSRAKCLG